MGVSNTFISFCNLTTYPILLQLTSVETTEKSISCINF